jgi:DNA-binding transcriptional regulator YdaS (Cro superfamily)
MDLHTFLLTTGRRQELAARLGVSANYLWQLSVKYRGRKPGATLARRIHEETLGVVSLQELRPDVFGEATNPHS